MESKNKSSPQKTPKLNKKSPSSKKKKDNNPSNSEAKTSQSSNNNPPSNSNQSSSTGNGKSNRQSDQNDRRYPKSDHYQRHSNSKNQRTERSNFNSDFNRRPYQQHRNREHYKNRVWKRPNYSNDRFEHRRYQNRYNYPRNCYETCNDEVFANDIFLEEFSAQNPESSFQQVIPTDLNQAIEPNQALDQNQDFLNQQNLLVQIEQEHINANEPAECSVKTEIITPDLDCNFPSPRIKTEKAEPEFNLESCINSNHQSPTISVIPISRLIKSEIQDWNRTDIIAPTTPTRGGRSRKPNLVQRKKGISKDCSLSENLVQRVANMDKVGIKNVINNSGTKYDAALKIQARKRLREEIRKQLKSMNFTPPEDNDNNVIIPDEIVDSMSIPAVVLDEIRKAFGIVLLEDKTTKMPAEITEKPSNPTELKPAEPISNETGEKSPKSPDLRSRLKMLEECKSQSEKPSVQIKGVRRRKSSSTEPILVIDSSSSSSGSSSSSSDSDTSSTSSGSDCSNSSSFKRRRRKKRILEANVVGNFEKLILPNLTTAQRRRYREKYSKTTKNSLLYIYGICVSRANYNRGSLDAKEQQKLKQNLSSADNAQALEFLMKAILRLFEKQKETLRKNKVNQIKSPNTVNRSPTTTRKSKDSDDDESERTTRRRTESANSVESVVKHQSTTDKLDKESAESAKSAKRVSLSDDGAAPVVLDTESDTEHVRGGGGSGGDENPPSRVWKSPGEKKCIAIESLPQLSTLGSLQSPFDIETSMNSLGMMQSPLAQYPFDIESLKSQSSLGDEAVSSIREIDVKLMELHKRKMYIEEMILKLQKDKMEVDLWTMKLQNEKFILLNSALANATSSSSSTANIVLATPKRKSLASTILDQAQSQKRLCQRDIVPIKANSAIQEIISKIGLKPKSSRTRTISSRSLENTETPLTTTKNAPNPKIPEEKEDSKISKSEENEKEKKDAEDEETIKTVEVPKFDYSNVENGNLEGFKLPITQIIVVGEALVAASEDGNIYKFNVRTRALESKFSKHTEAITQIFTCPRENFVYTTSLDGFLKKTSIENFGLELQSQNLQEPLQSIDIQWNTAFIGSRWGNIFTYDIKNNCLSESLLCSSKSSIIAIKATKEGPRKILIVSSKGNQINFRDAMTGLLLRSLDIPDSLHIYSILLDGGCVYCGTQRNEVHQYDFTTGGRMAIFQCGNGAVSMKLYKDKFIFVGCYDGFVYVLDKTTGCQIGRFPGSGKMILALEIAGDKLITSAKDNTMQIIDIPKYIATKAKG